MAIAPRLLSFVVCPRCQGRLQDDGGQRLKCAACHLFYPVRDNVPHLVIDEALDTRAGGKAAAVPQQNAVRFREKRQSAASRSFYLERGSCKVIGRPPNDPNKTTVMHMDLPLILDESTKGVIQHYIRKQFSQLSDAAIPADEVGHFRRTSDIIIDDTAVSRLHAIVFYDGKTVGVLDLVSKNGTFVNGQEVESRVLKPGDMIEIGDTNIVYEG
jgi:uncharacterized protein YbaR (Trm112 family)